ncbi:hypothetical protein H6G06_07750 [Anabaena sphaerica FACHB-251]|uniref:Uncharacterized protein n=1 Tax=Anabaena sphaerica FACHB-251 TaxID=2692883 RepID=A0A926WGH8_9NOST|nr:hypothetical protein [Anabaena sphaerica]MBD2293384.1 hypothetical protein [Anabaena sphaerica FACHB-251]
MARAIARAIALETYLVQMHYKFPAQVLGGCAYILYLMYINCRKGLKFRTGN